MIGIIEIALDNETLTKKYKWGNALDPNMLIIQKFSSENYK